MNMKKFLSLITLTAILLSLTPITFSQDQAGQNAADTQGTQASAFAETGLVGAWYLSFPLGGSDYLSELVNTVFDHSGGWYAKDGKIVAFTGETGNTGCINTPQELCRQASGQGFSIQGTYTSRSWKDGRQYLSYGGHPGYDYAASFGTNLFAPADGVLEVPTSDPINGNPATFNTFKIDHGNGYSTWFLHASEHISPRTVKRGEFIGKTGETGAPGAPHLHFEVRKGNTPVDPYGWAGGCKDPQTSAVNANLWINSGTNWNFNLVGNSQGWLPNNLECYSVHDGGFYIDPAASDPYIQGPPLVNVSASSFNTVEVTMASNAPDGNGAVYFTTAGSPEWNEDKRVPFTVTNNGTWVTYKVRMDGNSFWSGSITGIRLDPSNTGRVGTASDTIAFDNIKLTTTTGENCAAAQMTNPANGSTISSSTTLTWSAGAGNAEYWLYVGKSPGGSDIFNGSQGTSTSKSLSGLPAGTIYVRLWSRCAANGNWSFIDYSYTVQGSTSCAAAQMTSPANGSTISSSTTFNWSAGSGNAEYWLYVGKSPGGSDIFNGSQGTSTSKSLSGLPAGTIYVRLWSRCASNGNWSFIDYSYTVQGSTSCAAAQMTSPANGSTISSSTTFNWSAGSGNAEYWLYVGKSPGGSDIFNGTQGTSTSRSLSSLPAGAIYVRLWSRCAANGNWSFIDYSYTVQGSTSCAAAQMTSPANGSTISSATTFNWSAGSGNAEYWLYVGKSPGGSDIFNGSQGTSTSKSLSGLPAGTIYVRLWSRCASNGNWSFIDYSYTVQGSTSCAAAQMTSPANGSTISSATTFNWSAGSGNAEYWLYVGRSPGGSDIFNGSQGTSTSRSLSGLPAGAIYVRLWSRCAANGNWSFIDYSYTVQGSTSCAAAQMTSPANGSTISSATTFNWSAGSGNAEYWLYVGRSPGGSDIFNGSQGTSTSRSLSGLPAGAIYVRLWSRCASNGNWSFIDYSYTVR